MASDIPIQNLQDANDLKKHDEELMERKKAEKAKANEEMFLRRSLRISERLRALAKTRLPVQPVKKIDSASDNKGFQEDEYLTQVASDDLPTLIKQLSTFLSHWEGDTESAGPGASLQWDWLINATSGQSVLRAFRLESSVATSLESCRAANAGLPRTSWAVCESATHLLEEVVLQLRADIETVSMPAEEIFDLMDILLQSNIRNLLSAHDGVVEAWQNDELQKPLDAFTRQPTVYMSPVNGCYKIIALDDNGKPLGPPEHSILVNVVLIKQADELLGATVCIEDSVVRIGRIVSGGLIERSKLLNEGDEIRTVNGIDLAGMNVDEVCNTLRRQSGQIVFLVSPALPIQETCTVAIRPLAHLRALFSYDPSKDIYNPCKEVGLAFEKGDILHIFSTRDQLWWQAYREENSALVGAIGRLAGIIPSPLFQQQRSWLLLQQQQGPNGDSPSDRDSLDSGLESDAIDDSHSLASYSTHTDRISVHTPALSQSGGELTYSSLDAIWSMHGFKPDTSRARRRISFKNMQNFKHLITGLMRDKKLRNYYPNRGSRSNCSSALWEGDQLAVLESEAANRRVGNPLLLTYEPVGRYLPQPKRHRTIVLVGPAHVGPHLILERVVMSDCKKFIVPTIHTTREDLASSEVLQYSHLARAEFRQQIREHGFLEWGCLNRHYYGTMKSSLEKIILADKVAFLVLRPDSLRRIRRAEFLPFVVFVSPPSSIDQLRQLRQKLGENIGSSDEELKACLVSSRQMEERYGHFFDRLIVPRSVETAVEELRTMVTQLDRRPQWVPRQWMVLAKHIIAKTAPTPVNP